MPRLEPVGRQETFDAEPLTVPIVGYLKDGAEVITDIEFRPVMPTGASIDVLRASNAAGDIPFPLALDFVDEAIMPGQEAAWSELLHRKDLFIEQDTIIEVYKKVMAFYAERPARQRAASPRPTRVRSGSPRGTGAHKKTSTAGSPARASNSTRPRRGKD